jgi:hypothetical protein
MGRGGEPSSAGDLLGGRRGVACCVIGTLLETEAADPHVTGVTSRPLLLCLREGRSPWGCRVLHAPMAPWTRALTPQRLCKCSDTGHMGLALCECPHRGDCQICYASIYHLSIICLSINLSSIYRSSICLSVHHLSVICLFLSSWLSFTYLSVYLPTYVLIHIFGQLVYQQTLPTAWAMCSASCPLCGRSHVFHM